MIRDQVEGFEITDVTLGKNSNEAGTLTYLFEGLEFLYQMMKTSESEAIQQFCNAFASPEAPEETDNETMAASPSVRVCAFHWYATSACNFIKMIGWLHQRQDPAAMSPDAYLAKVLPEVEPWRNKVAAHFARHTPHRKDTPADEIASLIPPTALMNGRYMAGAYRVAVRRSNQTSASRLEPWSLTQVHEHLRLRFGLGVAGGEGNHVGG